MSVKPELAFDVCWEVYHGAREVLEAKRGLGALDLKEATKFLWRPDFRARINEWVADFALAGQAALESPEYASRMVLFRLHYLGLTPYENARHFLGLSEQGWVNWSEEVRRRVGKELLRRGMFPHENISATVREHQGKFKGSPTRKRLPVSVGATRVFTARR